MTLRNPFPQRKREVFRYYQYKCWECGMNGQDCGGTELHHIRSRISSSVFNGAVLCKRCHSLVTHSFEEEQKYMQDTAKVVFNAVRLKDYVIDNIDKEFLFIHKKYY